MYLYNNKAVFFCLLIQGVVSIVFIVIQKLGYFTLIKESENMKNTKDIELINIRKNRKNVHNVDNYVDKYVNRFIFCGLKLYTISRICGYLTNFLFVSWSIATIYGVYLECGIKEILWTIMLGILVVGGLFSVGWGVDNYKLEQVAKVNIKDYIENIIELNKNKEEVVRTRKEHAQNSINNVNEKTVLDYEQNNKDVVVMKEPVLDKIDKDNLGYLSESIPSRIKDEEEDIIEGFLKQYFA